MAQCDDIFQQIQALEADKRVLTESRASLAQVEEPEGNAARRFAFRGKDGQQYEASYDDLFRQISADPLATEEWARFAAEYGFKPQGADGQFENFRLLTDRMGLEGAVQLGSMLMKLTGDWSKLNPQDFIATTAIYDSDAFARDMVNAFSEGRINIESDRVSQAIAQNVAPFVGLEQRMARLRAYSSVELSRLTDRISDLRNAMGETGVAPSRAAKVEFLDSYARALFAHRSERLAKRKTGQVLQSLQRSLEDGSDAQLALSDAIKAAEEELGIEMEQLAQETLLLTPEQMVTENSPIRKIIEAADKGAAGVPDLEAIQLTLKTEGIDAVAEGGEQWKSVWKRNARAAYKDSLLFNPRTQVLSNYISQKVTFVAEGFKRVSGLNGWDLYGRRIRDRQLSLLSDNPEGLAVAQKQPTYINPLATGFFRDALKAQLDGARIAVEAATRAESVIKQSWQESFRKGFWDSNTPFAGNVDYFVNKGTLSLDDQYKAAQAVLDEPWDKTRLFFQFRDKVHVGLKVLVNSKIEKATGVRLPVYSALQALTAVDQRAGLRVFMTDRANELMLQEAAAFPDRTLKEWGDAVDAKLRDQLYQAEPSPQNIKDARAQFGLGPEDYTDDEIAAYIVNTKVGSPVLVDSGQLRSKDTSIALRMQGRQTEGLAGAVDQGVSAIRRSEAGDAMVSFWRSPYNQTVWDLSLASPTTPVFRVARAVHGVATGKLTPQMLAEAQSATVVWLSLVGAAYTMREQGLIVGNGPLEPNARRQWIERLNAEGKVPNSVFGIPFNMGGVPVLNSIFLMVDAMDVIDQGAVSPYDKINLWNGLVMVGAGQVMRMPGFRQVQMIYDAFSNGNENAFRRLAGWFANGQLNPASGVERMAEWATGTQRSDLRPDYDMNSQQERFDLDALPDDHPLKSAWNGVRQFVYESNPGISYWMGLRPKETTWLGRNLRRPSGIFRGEWPIGVPGIWEFNGGNYQTETWLEGLGLLDPPGSLMTGKLGAAYMTNDLAEEYNSVLGVVKPSTPYSRDSRFPGTVVWSGPEVTVGEPGRERTDRPRVDMTRFFEEATQGRTVREALEYVRTSKQWKRWEAMPEFTTDRSMVKLTQEQRQRRPGPALIKKIKEYYEDLAQFEIEKSNTPAAQQWKADQQVLQAPAMDARDAQRTLQETLR
jgi:hypothetical protein